jgi:UDP-glucose 4-epimerase
MNPLSGRRYLVTGGCGFIGSHVVDALLATGCDVVVLDDLSTGRRENLDPRARLMVGDVGDAAQVREAMNGADGCFHLAAIASVQCCTDRWADAHRVNQTGCINVMEAARAGAGGRARPVVFASSAAVYGDCPTVPLGESAPTLPISPYGADKLGAELHGRVAAAVFGSRVVALRFFNVFGPRQDAASPYSSVISTFIRRALAGQEITVFGDGEQTRDFVFVADVVRCLQSAMAVLEASSLPRFGAYNVCCGRSISVNRLAETIVDLCRSPSRITHSPARLGDIRTSLGDPSQCRRDLGFAAEVDLVAGLASTLKASSGLPFPLGGAAGGR